MDTRLLGFGAGRVGRKGGAARVEDAIGDGWRELGSARSFPGDETRGDKRFPFLYCRGVCSRQPDCIWTAEVNKAGSVPMTVGHTRQ